MTDTRVWWDGSEVIFVRWTDRSLVFAWCDAAETAIQMPRGVVIRLLEKGVLHIEGVTPDWIFREQQQDIPAAPRTATTRNAAAAAQPVVSPTTPAKTEPSSKLGAIARLIRKLSGEPKSSPRTAG